MSTIRRLAQKPGPHRVMACWQGHVRWIDPRFEERLAAAGLAADADWSALSPGTRVSDSRITNCFRIDFDAYGPLYFKRYVYTQMKKMRFFLRPSRALKEVCGYHRLAVIGVPTLNVVAFSEQRLLGRLVSACVVTEGIEAARNLEWFAREEWPVIPSNRRRGTLRAIREVLFAQMHRAHAAGFFHQDLHWRNILLKGASPEEYQTIWIDCPSSRFRPLRRRHALLTDLSTLARIAPDYLTPRQRFESLRVFFNESAPFSNTRRWFDRILCQERSLPARHAARRTRQARVARRLGE